MSDNDHEHRAYQVWDGDNRWAGTDEVRQLHYRITELALQLDRLEDAFGEFARKAPWSAEVRDQR